MFRTEIGNDSNWTNQSQEIMFSNNCRVETLLIFINYKIWSGHEIKIRIKIALKYKFFVFHIQPWVKMHKIDLLMITVGVVTFLKLLLKVYWFGQFFYLSSLFTFRSSLKCLIKNDVIQNKWPLICQYTVYCT